MLAVATLAISFAPLAAALAHAQSERFPAGDANMFRPGAAFTFYGNATDPARVEGLNTSLNIMTAQSAETAGTIATVRSGIADGVAASDADALARDIATSIEGTFAIIVQAGFLRAMSQADPTFGQMLRTAQMNVHLPGGQSVELPVLMAAATYSLTVTAAGGKLLDGAPAADVSGVYTIATRGECAVADGTLTVSQNDFVIEATARGTLVMFGAVGDGLAYLVSNERRFATITESDGGLPRISVPDRPSDLFEASLGPEGKELEFRSVTRGTCAFTLTPAG